MAKTASSGCSPVEQQSNFGPLRWLGHLEFHRCRSRFRVRMGDVAVVHTNPRVIEQYVGEVVTAMCAHTLVEHCSVQRVVRLAGFEVSIERCWSAPHQTQPAHVQRHTELQYHCATAAIWLGAVDVDNKCFGKPVVRQYATSSSDLSALGVRTTIPLGPRTVGLLPKQILKGHANRLAAGEEIGELTVPRRVLSMASHSDILDDERFGTTDAIPTTTGASQSTEPLPLEDAAKRRCSHPRGTGRPLNHAVFVQQVVAVFQREGPRGYLCSLARTLTLLLALFRPEGQSRCVRQLSL
mmetsp:Transcript_28008/g.73933  ORF Transcript_28008/g.73933 Transcript_28008/m.73933 type:complete len:296 (+) Transcript_28008:157-1044(+)